MRIQDLLEKDIPTGRPEVFLDMDGVIADFFGEYAKLANQSNYRMIPGKLRSPLLDKMQGTDFFYRLPKFPTTDTLVSLLTRVFGHYNICSSPLRGDFENSEQMKRAWIKENLNPQPKNIVITPNKPKMAPAVQHDGTPNILIDDRNTNITEWEKAGGIGIKYQADEDSLEVVIAGIKKAFEIIKGQRKHEPQDIISKDYGGDTIATNDEQNESAYVGVDKMPEPKKRNWEQANKESNEKTAAAIEKVVKWAQGYFTKESINESTLSDHEEELRDFVKWTCDKLKLKNVPRIEFQDSKESDDQKKTAHFDPEDKMMWIYTGNRNLADIMRSVAHELTHRKQDEQGRVTPDENYPGSKIEQEADAVAGYLMKLYLDIKPDSLE